MVLIRRLWFLMVIIVMVIPVQAQEESSSNAPYLYWYSNYLNAFVIERADGTDSRIFGEGLMPEGTNAVAGPGWSPSGEWFAWETPYARYKDRGWVLNVDEQKRVTVLDNYVDIEMQWSPTEDLLLAAVQINDPIADGSYIPQIRLFLIHPNQNEILASAELEGYIDYCCVPLRLNTTWTSDGQVALVWIAYEKDNLSEFGTAIFRFNTQDYSVERSDIPETLNISRSANPNNGLVFSPDLQFAAAIFESPVIYNLLIHTTQTLSSHPEKTAHSVPGGEIQWHPDQHWLITTEYVQMDGGGPRVNNVVDAETGFQRHLDGCCAHWLPSQVEVNDLRYIP